MAPDPMRSLLVASLVLLAGCPYQRWPDEELLKSKAGNTIDDRWKSVDSMGNPVGVPQTPPVDQAPGVTGARPVDLVVDDTVYRNTYYDFPREGAGDRDATLFDAACAPIAKVSQKFHDQVCVQGSGRLASGETVSFAKRDCACAAVCPRTSQKICYEKLDPARFPYGRGSTGGPITPLVTVAVDPSVIPLGTPVFIQEMVGVARPDGTPHDGCFVAQDRGLRVVGKHIDVFTGDPAVTQAWNARVPSNLGVHARLNDARCVNLSRLAR